MSSEQRPSPEDSTETRPAGSRPPRLSAAAALCAAEGGVLAGFGVYLLVMGVLGTPDSPSQAETGGLTLLVLAALPLVAARGLLLRRSWSRGPAVITQIMAVPVAWTLVSTGGTATAAGVALGAAAIAVLVLLVHPAATRALDIGSRDGR
ncbi:hypothetical protein [Streptomyces zingiberis]|uniref:Integral membrane protein n=1 Tax=Streptomyces zingiberis TaxID=2053010 RepID=A0ABX1BT61_9ACTN|nr:hypothetical protein [Streptomyces zingiberis]NJQ00902.1 hypothetical protein [Streptomyces zingiberis]